MHEQKDEKAQQSQPAPEAVLWCDTPLLQAKRRAFDCPTQENLDALIVAAQALPPIKEGTLGVPLHLRREPTPQDFSDPRFDVLWELMKRVDVDFRNGLFSGATGSDVCAVMDALDGKR